MGCCFTKPVAHEVVRQRKIPPLLTMARLQTLSRADKELLLRDSLCRVFKDARQQMSSAAPSPCTSATPSVTMCRRRSSAMVSVSRMHSMGLDVGMVAGVGVGACTDRRQPRAQRLQRHNMSDEMMRARRRWSYSPSVGGVWTDQVTPDVP